MLPAVERNFRIAKVQLPHGTGATAHGKGATAARHGCNGAWQGCNCRTARVQRRMARVQLLHGKGATSPQYRCKATHAAAPWPHMLQHPRFTFRPVAPLLVPHRILAPPSCRSHLRGRFVLIHQTSPPGTRSHIPVRVSTDPSRFLSQSVPIRASSCSSQYRSGPVLVGVFFLHIG
jgi:hypothetical protein